MSFSDLVRRASFDQLIRIIVSLKLKYYPTLDIIKLYSMRRRFAIIRINNFVLVAPITYAIYQPPICEPKTYRFLQTVVSKNSEGYFLDVGAAIGSYAIPVAEKGWNVVAIEPNPLAYAALLLNARLNDVSIKAINKAAYNKQGKIRLNGLYVETITLDDLREKFDIIKIDCDGCERHVVEGGLETLRRAKYIIIEERTETFEYVHKYLKALGKKVVAVEPLYSVSLSGILLKPRVKPGDFNVIYSS